MTTEHTEVSLDSVIASSKELDARTFLQRYRKHLQVDVYIASYYGNLTPANLESNFELVKARLESLKGTSPDLKFTDAPREVKIREARAAKKPVNKRDPRRQNSKVRRLDYVVEFFDSDGVVIDRIGAANSGDSVHRAEAKLANISNYARAEYYSTEVCGADGKPIRSPVQKTDAIAHVFARKSGPAMKNTASYSSKLEWGGKAKNSHSHFSKG